MVSSKLVDLETTEAPSSDLAAIRSSPLETDDTLSALFDELPSAAACEPSALPVRRSGRKRTANKRLQPLGDPQLPEELPFAQLQRPPCPLSVIDPLTASPESPAPVLPPLDAVSSTHVEEVLQAGGEVPRAAAADSSKGGSAVSAVEQAMRSLAEPEFFVRLQREDAHLVRFASV